MGDGLIGVATARALARAGVAVALVGSRAPGFASPAAAGFLAPTIEPAPGSIFTFALAARDRYPAHVAALRDETGLDTPLDFAGILRLPVDEGDVARLLGERSPHAHWLSSEEVRDIEPALEAPLGALLHHDDGLVDNARLLDVLDAAVDRSGVARIREQVSAVALTSGAATLTLADGSRLSAATMVLAAGAWATTIPGLPRPIPVAPVRGQILVIDGAPLRRPVYAAGGYLASRQDQGFTMVGSTYERVGFSPGVLAADLARFESIARTVVPRHPVTPVRSWSGLRPVSRDFHPILGHDSEFPSLIYACGHSRNGILMAPLTGEVVTSLVTTGGSAFDLAPFSIARFANGNG